MSDQTESSNPSQGAIPKDYLAGLKENFKFDLVAGLIVFMIALPLSLGIAIASGFPPVAGLITAIVGGVIGALIGGSHVIINGPAAGLIAIVYGAVVALGYDPATGEIDMMAGYRYTLAVGVVVGVLQVILGALRAGKLTNLFPVSVVHGMLAGIGVIIMAKQFHLALGVDMSGDMIATFAAMPSSVANLVPAVTAIGVLSLAIMVVWPMLGAVGKLVPAPLIVVVAGVMLGQLFGLDQRFLVQVPLSVMDAVTLPDFGMVATGVFWKWVVTLGIVASLETLLTSAAIDKMDPWKRRTPMNRELMGKGGANFISSALGGLPMIAEAVRSSANVMNGARTRWANVFHGLLLLVAVVAVPGLLNMIPLAALAGMLVYIGFRLAHPSSFKHAAHIGREELVYMVFTMVVVVLVDLLWGVISGFILATVVNAARGVRSVKSGAVVEAQGDQVRMRFQGAFGFLNFVATRDQLDALPAGKALTLDFGGASY